MKFKHFIPLLLGMVLVTSITSCRKQKDVLYFQNIQNVIDSTREFYSSSTIQTGDLLSIIVSSMDDELSQPYNLSTPQGGGSNNSPVAKYLVDSDGMIDYPGLERIKVAGLTRQELSDQLKQRISKFLVNPIVNVRIVNYRVTMVGEVNQPGVIETENEKLSILEAIALAGDMTYYAIRDSVMLVRTVDGVRTQHTVNLLDANLINSPYYYLKQNDLIYVRPTWSKSWEFNTKPFTAIITIIGLVVTLIALFR